MRGALIEDDAANWCAAGEAGFAGPAVDLVLLLKAATLARRVDIVRYRRTARKNRAGEDALDSIVQPGGAGWPGGT